MALFSKKTTKITPAKAAAAKPAVKTENTHVKKDVLGGAIVRPHITEKATFLAEKNTYVFEVNKNASKPIIAQVIRAMYNVTPLKITTATNPAKKVVVRGKIGNKPGIKKAYVTLKKGEKIEFA